MSYLMIHKELYSILITAVYSVQLKGEVDVVPHVVFRAHMVCKALHGYSKNVLQKCKKYH